MIDLNNHLEKWIGEGIITAEQAELMRRSVADRPPREQEATETQSRIPIVTEIFGYVGAALAVWAVVFLVSEFWANLADWAQAGLFAAVALVLFASGSALLDATEPALGRLSGVLWAGSVIALGGALYVVFDPILDYSVNTTWALIGAIAAAAGAVMLKRQPTVAQHVVFFAAVMTAIMSALNLGAEPEIFVFGFVAWGIGLVWILVSRAGVLQPSGTGMVLGAITMLYGAQLAAIEGETDAFGILLGLATAGLFATAGVVLREKLTIVLGGIGIFWFVPQAMFYFFGETFGGMFGLFVSGLAIVALAIWFSRHREAL
jgi:hypothetical protein